MAGLTLREYIREIEKQVEGKRYDEAIAHCHYLLQIFPKHVEAYRLLGKAFLENQRLGDAADIFQRVLSAFPDDFVSHAGMSIIREDEGNFDEAIWHMKRAFDVQPSNTAIQEELRRMIGRRDNIEPPKIRLTRGALARMYFKGELFPQAVAETRAALAENPDRLDLQALLAEIYYSAGQKSEAVEVANALLRRLPYCWIANQILFETLKSADRDDDSRTYLERLGQLDPYYAYTGPNAPRPEAVPDTAVRIEKLDWKVGQTAAGRSDQPLWAASLGVNLDESIPSGSESLPDWLAALPESASSEIETGDAPVFFEDSDHAEGDEADAEIVGAGDLPYEPGAASSTADDRIPDWMQDLGWNPAAADGPAFDDQMPANVEPSGEAEDAPLSSADMPEWLQSISPPDETASAEATEDEETAPWLEGLFPAIDSDAQQTTRGTQEIITGDQLPDWLTETAEAPVETAAELPDWLTEVEPPSEAAEAPVEAAAELPDWLTEVEPPSEAAEAPVEAAAELPDWLTEAEPPAEAAEASVETSAELPDWLTEAEPPAEAAKAPVETSAEIPDWLTEAEPPAEAAEAPVEATAELPDWLTEAEPPAEAAEAPVEAAAELPDWLTEAEPPVEAIEPKPETTAGLPGWLSESEAPLDADAPTTDDLPDWLRAELTSENAIETSDEAPVEEAGLPEWLTQESPAEDSAEGDLPQLDDEPESEADWLLEVPDATSAEIPPTDDLPTWMEEMPAEPVEAPAESLPPAEVDAAAPADGTRPKAKTEPPAPQPAAAVSPADLEDAYSWLASMLLPQSTAPAPTESAPPAETPAEAEYRAEPQNEELPFEETPSADASSLIEQADEKTAPTASDTGVDFGSIPLDEDAAFAWLENLAVRQGATEALLLSPEERQEIAPEWIQQAAAEAGPLEELPEDAAAAEAEADEFLAAIEPPIFEAVEVPPLEESTAEAEPAGQASTTEAETTEPIEIVEPETGEPTKDSIDLPELPDWLVGEAVDAGDEAIEWQPPAVARRRYDLNQASLAELERLPGIGFIMAQRIVDHRAAQGRFESVEDLLKIPEFTDGTLESVRESLYVVLAETPSFEEPPVPSTGLRLPGTEAPVEPETPAADIEEAPEPVLNARELAASGEWESALEAYQGLVTGSRHLDFVIQDLSSAARSRPEDIALWQALGDAYMRSNRLKEALEAYGRAEKLLLR